MIAKIVIFLYNTIQSELQKLAENFLDKNGEVS